MNPIVFALRKPMTVMMLVLALGLGGLFSVYEMQKDIFPALNQPQLYVIHNYGGMDPKQIEGLITNVYELFFQYINGVEHVESRSIQSMVMLKLFFQPGIDMAEATAQTVAYCNRALSVMPTGSLPPYVVRLDAGSLPVGYLVFESPTRSVGVLQDMALYRVRPMFSGLAGISSPPPFGGNVRTIVVNVDPDRLRSYNLSPQDVVEAIDRGNFISPSGNVTIKDQMTVVPVNTMVLNPQELRNIPLKLGENVYIRDVGTVADATDIPVGYALVNGRKSVYLPVVKQASASTLTVVNAVKANLARFQAVVPDDVKVSYQFDESPIVYRAIESVGVEGALGAGLTGLMVLLFLRDLRAVIIVVLNIPLALLGSIAILNLTGNSINIMTLGGLALAIGILVDEATVEIENIHTQMEYTPSMARAVRQGNMETAVPRLLALLCILSVFIPSFIMTGAVRALFVPLSLAVGGAMVTSYLLSSTFVPVLSVWLLENRHGAHGHGAHGHGGAAAARPGFFVRMQNRFERVVDWTVAHRRKVVLSYLLATGAVVVLVGGQLGRELFPRVDTGQFQLRVRPPQGTRFELTTQVAQKTLDVIADEVGQDNVEITMGYAGGNPPQFTINMAYLWSRGPDDSLLRVGLREASRIDVFALQERLRKVLPEKVGAWFRQELVKLGVAAEVADRRVHEMVFAFEPGDLIAQTMSLGSPAPIEVVVSGRNMADSSLYMDKLREQFDGIAALRDSQVQQSLHYPTVQVTLDRERAGLSGVTARDIGQSLIAATYSSRYTARNFWRDDASGNSYQVQVQVPQPSMTEATDVELVPLTTQANRRQAAMAADSPSNPTPPLLIRDVARVMRSEMPGEVDRYNMRRYLSLTANIEGEDLGRVITRMDAAIARAGQPPRGIEVELRGQVQPMREMFRSLAIGLAVAVVVILIMLTAYFQAPRLALTAVASVPAVLCGVVLALWGTKTTLNIESFMGAIMAVGVAVSNAIMLVSFGDRHRLEDGMSADRAVITAARGRLRPIIMTGCAMIAGMIPMSLALEEGSEQNAPLGRAVIGGMALATFATLLVLPAVFALLLGGASSQSPSLDPDDPASTHYDPRARRTSLPAASPSASARPPNRPIDNRRAHPMLPTAIEQKSPPHDRSVLVVARARPACRGAWRSQRRRLPDASIAPPRREPRFLSPGCEGGVRGGEPGIIADRVFRAVLPGLLAVPLLLATGCRHSERGAGPANAKTEHGKTAGITVIHPEKRDIRMTVTQPGTIQAFEVAPIFSRIAGYVEKYNFNIGDRVKAGDILLDMWIPDIVEQLGQKSAAVKRAQVQIRVVESALKAADARVETAQAHILSAQAGVKRAQASYDRWDSEYKRLAILVQQKVLDDQVRDETYRQFEEAVAARDQANAMVSETKSALDQAIADRDRARVDVEAARADLVVAEANEREAKVVVEYGRVKAPFKGVITQRNISPGDYLQPGGGDNGRPLFVVEQVDPVRVFVGVPELASYFVHDNDTAVIRLQAIPGASRVGKVVRSGFSLNPSTRTLQTEIDIPNSDGHLHPGWYVTVEVVIDRKRAWTVPSNAIGLQGGQNYFVYFQVDGKPVRTPIIVGPSDDTHTEVIKKYVPNRNTNDWPTFEGTETILVGNMDALAAATKPGEPPPADR